jgi:sulfatase maturation enzyme AslB (radical SAM superfamily)
MVEYPGDLAAGELMMSARCNLRCTYCYISKGNDPLAKIDDEIVKEFKEKGILRKLRDTYGDKDLERLGLWGAEPTLHLEYLTNEIKDIINFYDNFIELSISSNFYAKTSVDKILNLIKEVCDSVNDRKFSISVQTSIDGPPRINDESRVDANGKGSTQNVIDNLKYMLDELEGKDINPKVEIRNNFKATVGMKYIREMAKDIDNLYDYFKFFDLLGDEYEKRDLPDNFKWCVTTGMPTLVIPGEYTAEDGEYYAEFLEQIRQLSYGNMKDHLFNHFRLPPSVPYMNNLIDMYYKDRPLREQNRAFACGASGRGFANGLNTTAHICHRAYFLEEKKYAEIVEGPKDKYARGILEIYRHNHIVDKANTMDFIRQRYNINAYRDFALLNTNYIYASIKSLALCGQARHEYLEDDELCKFASIFINRQMNCVMEAILQTGTFHFTPMQEIKLWVNGAFQKLIDIYNEYYERGLLR